MPLEKLIEASIVTFPRDITLDEAEELIRHLAENLPAEVNYQVLQHKTALDRGEGIEIDPGTVKISGRIRSTKNVMAFDSFEFKPSKSHTSKLSEMSFVLIPGYDEFCEYSPSAISLWGEVKKETVKYFNK